MSTIKQRKKEFIAGYGAAIAGLARDHMEDDLAGYLLRDSGFSLRDFETCGLESYDLDVIRNLYASQA